MSFFTTLLYGQTTINWPYPRYKRIGEYLKLQKKFFSKLCRNGADHKYQKLYKNYLGKGYVISRLSEKELDHKAIQLGIDGLSKKIDWVTQQIDDFPKDIGVLKETKEIQKLIDKLLKLKYQFFKSKVSFEKIKISNHSKSLLLKLSDRYKLYLNKVPFLGHYIFPVDYFNLRKEYDFYKHKKDLNSISKKNAIYMQRKLLEDGTFNDEHSRSDKQIRAVLSTIYLRLEKDEEHFLDEDLRYDLEYILEKVRDYVNEGQDDIIKRLKNWRKRLKQAKIFYKDLLKNHQNPSNHKLIKYLEKLATTRYQLKDFTLKKLKDSYKFWMRQSELMQALYVIETILFNEVGDLDGRNALERKDVAQLVLNRHQTPRYYSIEPLDQLYPYLKEVKDKRILKSRWLNLLFKEGEFSFTYYFIPSSVKIYCPDMSRNGLFLRRENLKIALDILKKGNYDFAALRYFSRCSMTGRIDMTPLWKDYLPIEERPGIPTVYTNRLKQLYKKNDFRYLYNFKNQQQVFEVLEFPTKRLKEDVFVFDRDKFYTHRNPNYFKYFKAK